MCPAIIARRAARRATGLEADRVLVPQRQADVVQALDQLPAGVVADLERLHQALGETAADDATSHRSRSTVTSAGAPPRRVLDERHDLLRQHDGQQPRLGGVVAEDVAEPRRDHRHKP